MNTQAKDIFLQVTFGKNGEYGYLFKERESNRKDLEHQKETIEEIYRMVNEKEKDKNNIQTVHFEFVYEVDDDFKLKVENHKKYLHPIIYSRINGD
jgi:hypothetical protein